MELSRLFVIFGILVHGNVATSFSSSGSFSRSRRPLKIFSTGSDNEEEQTSDDEMLKSLTEKYLGSELKLPTESLSGRSRLGDLYDSEELSNILDIHNEIASRTQEKRNQDLPEELIPSIHDLVLQAVGGDQPAIPELWIENEKGYSWFSDSIREKMSTVVAIASDVDGTLIGSSQSIHPRTKESIIRAIEASFSPQGKLKYFFPATGKTRWGALNSLGPEIASVIKQCPGVYIQGLYCIIGDTVIFEKKLNKDSIEAAEKLVEESQTSIIAYDGDDLYTTKITKSVSDLHEIWGEPMSKKIDSIAGHTPGIHKILICDDDVEKLAKVRKELEALAKENGATVTQALPTMLELLPEGCSKALGVEKVCKALGIDAPTGLLALGDAENDVEMLKLAAVGVAVGNGCQLAKEAADIVLDETSDEGGAGLAIEVLAGI